MAIGSSVAAAMGFRSPTKCGRAMESRTTRGHRLCVTMDRALA